MAGKKCHWRILQTLMLSVSFAVDSTLSPVLCVCDPPADNNYLLMLARTMLHGTVNTQCYNKKRVNIKNLGGRSSPLIISQLHSAEGRKLFCALSLTALSGQELVGVVPS